VARITKVQNTAIFWTFPRHLSIPQLIYSVSQKKIPPTVF